MNNNIGKIKSIAVRNFLTYDELKFSPGFNLNVIIGPNGTGKSSIVAAIILGCGGKPSILSRSKDISDYVKNGKTKATIEIQLIKDENDENSIVFSRTFDKSSKETYRINGENSSAKAYSDLIRQYNIHVDNLCMFLPQDRVQDFTKLNPQEILYNTQKSVCSQEMIDAFESLKEKREAQKDLTKSNNDIQIQLDDHINRNNQLHTLIENNKLKDKLSKECDLYKKKLAWLEFDRVKAQYDEAYEDIRKLKESIEHKKEILMPLEKRQSEIAGTKKALQNSISSTNTAMIQFNTDIDKLFEISRKLENEISEARQNFKNIVTNAKRHVKEINELELVVSLERKDYEKAQQQMRDEGDFNSMMKEFDNKIRENKTKIEKIMAKMEAMNRHLDEKITPEINNSRRKIEFMNDKNHQKFQILRTHYEDAFTAYKWLEANRGQFRGTIFNPIITEISVVDKKFAKYVENIIANRDLESFLCTNKEDMRDLIKIFRTDLKLQVNVGYTNPDDTLRFQTIYPIDKLAHFGIYAYLIDLIEGPIPVLNYLCSLYRIHTTAIGNDKTFECASRLPNDINVFFSTNHRFAVNISAYTGKKNVSSSEIYPRNIINISVDEKALEAEHERMRNFQKKADQLKTQRIPMEQEIVDIERRQNEIRNQKNTLSLKFKNIKAIEVKLKKKEAELENLKNHKIDINQERKLSKNNVDKMVNSLMVNNSKIYHSLSEYKKSFIKNLLAKKKLVVFDTSTGNIDEQIFRLQHEIGNVIETLRRANNVCTRANEEMEQKKQEALNLTENKTPQQSGFKYKDAFKNIPNEIHVVHDKIFEMQGRIDCIRGIDPRILEEYEERKQQIEELQHQIKNEHERTAKLEKQIQVLHEKWFPEIQRIVETINDNFSEFFAKMGFVGEIELIRKDERDYNDYGIQIRVQYRDNEKLQALNRHVQSGGERAVAIAVYTLSLQHLTMVPFRCVDEINQGMDPRNEKKIFQMLVDITCRPGQSQYFFVTPKLLPNLPHNDLMRVTIVHNSQKVDDSYVFLYSDMEMDVE